MDYENMTLEELEIKKDPRCVLGLANAKLIASAPDLQSQLTDLKAQLKSFEQSVTEDEQADKDTIITLRQQNADLVAALERLDNRC